jgi:hypothetical protein
MKKGLSVAASIAILVLATGSAASAQSVLFYDINDAVSGKDFDAQTTSPDPLNPNRLKIGFSAGTDPSNWTNNAFTVSTAAFYRKSAMDTISFVVQAPEGFYVSAVTYSQTGSGSAVRLGTADGGANLVVDGQGYGLGLYSTNPTLSETVDLTGQAKTVVSVSVTNAMFVNAPPNSGSARLSLTGAFVEVQLQPLALAQ